MSKFQECMDTFDKEFKKLGIKYDAKLLTKVAKACGPSLYNRDSSKVSSGDKKELERVRKNFLIKKLGLADTPKLDEGIQDVIQQIGKFTLILLFQTSKHFLPLQFL